MILDKIFSLAAPKQLQTLLGHGLVLTYGVHVQGVASRADFVAIFTGSTANVDMLGLNMIDQALLVLSAVITSLAIPASEGFLHQTGDFCFNHFW